MRRWRHGECDDPGASELTASTSSADARAPSAPTSESIREAALRLFAAKGYAATSMRQIALAVGIRPASLYHHFPSKEEILWDLTRSALHDLELGRVQALTDLGDASAQRRLAAFVRAHVRFHALHSEQARLVNSNLDSLSGTRRLEAVAARDAYERRLHEILAAGSRSGEFDVPVLRVATYAILQMCTSVSAWFSPGGALTVSEVCEAYADLVLRMTHPLSGDRPPGADDGVAGDPGPCDPH